MNSIKKITTDELRQMEDSEGIIFQGCGGNLQEWVDGINEILTESGILFGGTYFKEDDVRTFENGNITNLLFPFSDDVLLDIDKLAVWRLNTYSQFGGTWLSDYIENRLGGFDGGEQRVKKPDCPLLGQDGNIFNLMGVASRTLKENGMKEEAKEMCDRIIFSGSYDEALGIIGEYVNITEAEDFADDEGMEGMDL